MYIPNSAESVGDSIIKWVCSMSLARTADIYHRAYCVYYWQLILYTVTGQCVRVGACSQAESPGGSTGVCVCVDAGRLDSVSVDVSAAAHISLQTRYTDRSLPDTLVNSLCSLVRWLLNVVTVSENYK